MKNSIAWAYLVVSSEDQSDSIVHQLAWAKDTAEKRGWTLARIFDGVASGKTGVRTKFEEMLTGLRALPKEERPEYILLTRLDRIGRGDLTRSMVALQSVNELGPKVWSREENGEVKVDGAMLQLIAAVKFAVAAQENEVRIDKAKATYTQRRKARETDPRRAVTSKGPYGTRFEGGYLVAQEPEADAIRMMFAMRLEGFGSHVIAKKMHDVAPPIVQKNGVTRPLRWDSDLVGKLLKRYSYVDAQVVSESDWHRAQAMRQRPGGSRPLVHDWPLSGALKCSCGTPLRGMTNTRNQLFYYGCPDRYRKHGKFVLHRREKMEEQFWSLIWLLNKAPIFPEPREDAAQSRKLLLSKLSLLRAETGKVAARRQKVWDAFEAGHLRQDSLQGRIDALDAAEIEAAREASLLEAELQAMKATEISADERKAILKSTASRWRKADATERRAMAKLISRALGGLVVLADGTLLVGGEHGNAVNA